MAGTALKIDDDYVLDMGTTLSDNETELQSGVVFGNYEKNQGRCY